MNGRKDVNGILVQLPLPKGLDEEKILADIKSTITAIEPILEQSSSVEEMATHIDDIKNMESVDSVWTVGSDVIVQIRDWRKIFYHFHDMVAFFPLLLLGLDHLMKTADGGYDIPYGVRRTL